MKNKIRNEIKLKRKEMNPDDAKQKSFSAAWCFLNSELYLSANTIMLYMPLGNETDTGEIVKKAFEDGKRIVLPVTERSTGWITPFVFERGATLKKGSFSVLEPQNAEIAKKSEIDTVIVPGIAFDKAGSRIGFGKGCYDMFLDGLNAVKIGFCYDFQVMDEIPSDDHDIRMDFLVTEKGVLRCQ
ncbi:MAG: 5-formyltetrahydrofolate cyclo-ligase [Clostridia bacterium]|nr:5-formyltetrahydrofolate cyclo-ligase [Clostridia bacterium]